MHKLNFMIHQIANFGADYELRWKSLIFSIHNLLLPKSIITFSMHNSKKEVLIDI